MSIPTLHQQLVCRFVEAFNKGAEECSDPAENFLYRFYGDDQTWVAMRPEDKGDGIFHARFWTRTHYRVVPDARKYLDYLLGDEYGRWVKKTYRSTCFDVNTERVCLVYENNIWRRKKHSDVFVHINEILKKIAEPAKRRKARERYEKRFRVSTYPAAHLLAKYLQVKGGPLVFMPMYNLVHDTRPAAGGDATSMESKNGNDVNDE